jgi:phosphatidylinositol glycan class M
MLGRSTFVPGLWGSSLLFYAVDMWILGIIVEDVGKFGRAVRSGKGVEANVG